MASFFFEEQMYECGILNKQKEIEVDEDLPGLFDAVKLSQADELLSEYHNLKDNYGFETHDPDTIKTLEECRQPKRSILGTPWYLPLANLDYAHKFLYFGSYISEREKMIEDDYEFED